MLLDILRQDDERIAQAGPKAIKEALAAGVSEYYLDSALGEGIVKQMPDGTIHLIELRDGVEVILKTFAPP